MSDTLPEITRRSRSERPAREVHRKETAPGVTIELPDQISPEDALAETQRQLKESDQRNADARRQQREAEERARRAEAAAAQATTTQQSGRLTAVTSAVDTAKALKAAALAQYKAAREAGDIEAEVQANDHLSVANTELMRAQTELEWLKSQPAPAAQPQPQAGPSDAAKRWIEDHPEFNVAGAYRRAALGAHEEAVARGLRTDSQDYVDYIDQIMANEFGEGHGKGQSQRQQKEPPVRDRSNTRSDAAPPSRSSAGGQSGWREVVTDLGTITFRDEPGGGRRIRFADRATADNFEEGAKTSFGRLYERNAAEALKDFAEGHIEEFLEGGETIKRGDGRRMG